MPGFTLLFTDGAFKLGHYRFSRSLLQTAAKSVSGWGLIVLYSHFATSLRHFATNWEICIDGRGMNG